MKEIRWHGRGGQGGFTASRLMGIAAGMFEEKYALAFPSFGPERRGAPVLAYTKIDDKKIISFLNNKGFSYTPYWKNETPFNEPENVLEEIIKYDGFIGIKDHVYLVNDFDDPKITITDPADVSKIEKNLYSVRKEMEESGNGYFCLLKNKHL